VQSGGETASADLGLGWQADSERETLDCPCPIGLLAALDADKRFGKYIKNPFGRVAVAEGVAGLRHRAIRVGVRKQLLASRNDRVDLCPDQAGCSSLDGFRTLCRVAKNKNRFAESRRFFLDPAGTARNPVAQQAVRADVNRASDRRPGARADSSEEGRSHAIGENAEAR
jgi:hypothetical protein